jgi:hypothetical protein
MYTYYNLFFRRNKKKSLDFDCVITKCVTNSHYVTSNSDIPN